MVVTYANKIKFYFSETGLGKSISASNSKYAVHTRDYLTSYNQNCIQLRDVLELADARIVNDKAECDIDLSNPEKDTFIKLLTGD